MTIIGITGGTGAGKTTVLRALASLGALVIDCDEVYHELLRSSAGMLEEIEGRFPNAFLAGVLDRKALGRMAFCDGAALSDLNAITHRYVGLEVNRLLEGWRKHGGTLAAIDAIYLIESGRSKICDITVGVTAPREVRIERIMARDGLSREYAELRADAQKPDSFYEGNCDYVLHGSYDTPAEFEKNCREFFLTILEGITNER